MQYTIIILFFFFLIYYYYYYYFNFQQAATSLNYKGVSTTLTFTVKQTEHQERLYRNQTILNLHV